MIKGTKNQLHNINNASQGDTKKVLTVCSAGLLRSATLQNYLIRNYNFNVRNCGTAEAYALVPISEALVKWANMIVFVNRDNYMEVRSDLREMEIPEEKIYLLNIPDWYGFNDANLISIITHQWEHKMSEARNNKQDENINK